MALEKENVDFIFAFIRNIDKVLGSSDQVAADFAEDLRQIVISRVGQNTFLGGLFHTKPYSDIPIKAYKLGRATVSGSGMGRELTIGGVLIDDDDWYWGEKDRIKKNLPLPTGGSGFDFGDRLSKPVPIFVPGYRGWRVDYNSLPGEVDLHFTGNMLDNFELDIHRTRGSNQYGGRYTFSFKPDNEFKDQSEVTDYFRRWMAATYDELEDALSRTSNDLVNILFVR